MKPCLAHLAVLFLTLSSMCAQNRSPDPVPGATAAVQRVSIAGKWHFFVQETINPMTLAGGAFNAGLSQVTKSAPDYRVGTKAYMERFAASITDIASQNFCVDFLMAVAFHEDTRYLRRGPGHGTWSRVGWAISRAFVTRTDAGRHTVNWANFAGSALAGGISSMYYPSADRTKSAFALRYGAGIGGGALTNLLPEFGPDVWNWLKRHRWVPGSHPNASPSDRGFALK